MKKKSKLILLCGFVPIIAAASTAGARYTWDRCFRTTPQLVCPHTLDLGERPRGEVALAHFRIKNGGTATLTANEFRTSCSCAGVERDMDGSFSRVDSVQLLPGEEIELTLRVGINARSGENQLVGVSFATNDPGHPTWQMQVLVSRVTGGYVPEPAAALFGPIPLGEKTVRIIDLYDNNTPGRQVEKVRVTHPEHLTAILLPLSEEDKHRTHQTVGKLFARIEVTPRSELAGRFDGEVQISLKDETRPSESIPALGEVVSLAESRPTVLVLPRRIQNQPVRSGEVLIFSHREKPIDVVLDSLPPEVVAELRVVPDHPDQRLLNIEWRPAADRKKQPTAEVRIRLRVRSEGEETKLEVPVLLMGDQS